MAMQKTDKQARAQRIATLYAGFIAQGQTKDNALNLAFTVDAQIWSFLSEASTKGEKDT